MKMTVILLNTNSTGQFLFAALCFQKIQSLQKDYSKTPPFLSFNYVLIFDQLKLSEINDGKFNFLENLSFPFSY